MARDKGCKKYGGRQKGTPNRKTLELSNYFDEKGFFIPDKIIETFELLEPEKKAELLLKLMEYLYPKRKAVEVKAEVKGLNSIADLVRVHS